MNNKITYIPIEKLSAHPDNPRKELGDLTELAESIKESGIFQNLTVIPWISSITRQPADDESMNGYYTVVIGHRRMAAARLAGLKELPCIISEMDYATQISTMLLENMQRSDLTVYEQAEGFQMMMDIGMTASELSRKTGFSNSTISKRTRLLELDKDKFKQGVERGATLADFAELNKIEDIETKNRLLESIGTTNFDFELKSEIRKQNEKKNERVWIEYLNKFATKIDDYDCEKYSFVRWLSVKSTMPPKEIPEDAGEKKYFYFIDKYSSQLLTERNKKDAKEVNQRHQAEIKRAKTHEKLDNIYDDMSDLREEFMRKYKGNEKDLSIIGPLFIEKVMMSNSQSLDEYEFAQLLNIKYDDDEEGLDGLIKKVQIKTPTLIKLVAICIFNCISPYDYSKPYNYNNIFIGSKKLKSVYDFLTKLGYQMSDTEREVLDGTHELYKTEV